MKFNYFPDDHFIFTRRANKIDALDIDKCEISLIPSLRSFIRKNLEGLVKFNFLAWEEQNGHLL